LKHDLDSLKLALASAPANHVAAQLTRLVPFLHLAAAPLPNWLYASAGPNRYNPAGIHCVYFGETTEVAQTEYLAAWRRVAGRDQPVATYYAEAFLHRVLDVTSAGTLRALNLSSPQLFKAWRKARYPTVGLNPAGAG
jgi:hypothetical protein